MASKEPFVNRIVRIYESAHYIKGAGWIRRWWYRLFAGKLLLNLYDLEHRNSRLRSTIGILEKDKVSLKGTIKLLKLELKTARKVDPTAEFLDNQRNFSQNQTIRRLKQQIRDLGGVLEED